MITEIIATADRNTKTFILRETYDHQPFLGSVQNHFSSPENWKGDTSLRNDTYASGSRVICYAYPAYISYIYFCMF